MWGPGPNRNLQKNNHAESTLAVFSHLDVILGQGAIETLGLAGVLAQLLLLQQSIHKQARNNRHTLDVSCWCPPRSPTRLATHSTNCPSAAADHLAAVRLQPIVSQPTPAAVLHTSCLTMTVKLYWLFSSLTPIITVPRLAALPARTTPSGGLQKGME